MSNNSDKSHKQKNKIALVVGNSRLHWGLFVDSKLSEVWDSNHLLEPVESNKVLTELSKHSLITENINSIPIYIASVVPQQTKLWHNYPNFKLITLKNIELKNIYSTLGIDRALAVWGGGETYGYPCLVIDGGTALTFTGANQQKELIGGAILPGLRSQFLTLKQKTAALPKVNLPATLPPRWASDTENAIASGIIYTTIAGIHSYIIDWQKQYPDSQIIFTGGNGELLTQYFQDRYPNFKSQIKSDRNLIFYAMQLAIINSND